MDNCTLTECEIVLLSTVYIAKEDAGFWKHENRICVALTRAKSGLYIIGNMNNLIGQCELWKNVKSSLQSLHSLGIIIVNNLYLYFVFIYFYIYFLGNELTLECSIHNGTFSKVSKGNDFINRKCPRPCSQLLKCNHYCKSICHTQDREHMFMFKCRHINCRFVIIYIYFNNLKFVLHL